MEITSSYLGVPQQQFTDHKETTKELTFPSIHCSHFSATPKENLYSRMVPFTPQGCCLPSPVQKKPARH